MNGKQIGTIFMLFILTSCSLPYSQNHGNSQGKSSHNQQQSSDTQSQSEILNKNIQSQSHTPSLSKTDAHSQAS